MVVAELSSSATATTLQDVSPYIGFPFRCASDPGRHLGRPGTSQRVINEMEELATTKDLSIRAIQKKIAGRASAVSSAKSPNAPEPR